LNKVRYSESPLAWVQVMPTIKHGLTKLVFRL